MEFVNSLPPEAKFVVFLIFVAWDSNSGAIGEKQKQSTGISPISQILRPGKLAGVGSLHLKRWV